MRVEQTFRNACKGGARAGGRRFESLRWWGRWACGLFSWLWLFGTFVNGKRGSATGVRRSFCIFRLTIDINALHWFGARSLMSCADF